MIGDDVLIRTNRNKIVKISVQGKIQHPMKKQEFITDGEGMGHILTATGGICYNVKVGDYCMGLMADHTEPGVTTSNDNSEYQTNTYSIYSCIGNKARVVTGDGKGSVGYVTGKHDMSNILIYFDESILRKLTINDEILIEAYGQGLKLYDYPNVHIMNIDPDMFEVLGIKVRDGKLIVPVVKRVPAYLMGSGIGSVSAHRGDYDIMTQDMETIKKLGLEDLRFGDIVLLEGCDTAYGRGYFKGASTIGVITHGDCLKPGHGPGVTTIMSSRTQIIEGIIDKQANIAGYHPLTSECFISRYNN